MMIAATPIIDKESNLVTVDTLQLSLLLALLGMLVERWFHIIFNTYYRRLAKGSTGFRLIQNPEGKSLRDFYVNPINWLKCQMRLVSSMRLLSSKLPKGNFLSYLLSTNQITGFIII